MAAWVAAGTSSFHPNPNPDPEPNPNPNEVGAGYTSLWLLQALADNEAELRRCRQTVRADGYLVS